LIRVNVRAARGAILGQHKQENAMSHVPHSLAADFPVLAAKISALKEKDAHFANLVGEYNAVNEKVYRAESRLDTISEEDEEHLRRARAFLKDKLWALMK
jgi:uncharacterized protein